MDQTIVFYCILFILVGEFILATVMNYLNAKRFKDPIPTEVADEYCVAPDERERRGRSGVGGYVGRVRNCKQKIINNCIFRCQCQKVEGSEMI